MAIDINDKEFLGSVQMEVEALIQGRQIQDSRLRDAIILLNKQLERVSREVSPLVKQSLVVERGVSDLAAPTNFTCFSSGTTVRFTWDEVPFASQYEVRHGTDWDTADFKFRTSGLQGNIDPLLYGSYDYLIKTIDSRGNLSAESSSTSITVPVIAAPSINVSVIDNNVLLTWTEPISLFKIDYYLVDKSGDAATAGRVDGTFTSFFEVVAGTYNYTIRAVDLAGNIGNTASVSAVVATPPDFALQSTITSGLNGTRVNVLRRPERPSLLACWLAQTWHEHFQVHRSWLDIEDQITAGYPIYIQPTVLTGSYEEVIDYGVVISNTIATINWNSIFHTPTLSTVVLVRMATSLDGVNYSAFTNGSSQYFSQLRYLKFRLEFTSENDKALLEIYNVVINLNVKRENDGGEVNALATDVGGTTVYFTKSFRDVDSITCTTKSVIEPFVTIFDFQDIPNPTFFKVFVFDTMGARVTKLVDWKARGIV
jgi:hypothetical protein